MYNINNSILEKDGEKVYAIGQSYYPSFHEEKYPVPPHGDRIGEMKKDLKEMAEMGFNHVRFAAIGLTKLDENGKLIIDTPLIDEMIKEADKNNISVSVRLQGYAVNLRDFKNVIMIDNHGEEQDTSIWYDFIQTCLCHEGLAEDDRTSADGLAVHYAENDNVVAFQIYNEPHYPGKTFFDYQPSTIAAYRKWLVEKKILTPEEAKNYEPPRERKEQSNRMWALWRIFCRDCLTKMLNNASDGAKKTVNIPTYTCFTPDQISMWNSQRGCDFFANAKSMDVVGYTIYIHGAGVDYYPMCLAGDTAVCAAMLEEKQSWCVELDARTTIPPSIFNRNTYAVLGVGAKGIVYYQWRGDYPSSVTPEPNGFGFVNYDGSKTANYENGKNVVGFISKMSDLIVNTDRDSDGIGLLHSDYALFNCDARENSEETRDDDLHNSWLLEHSELYRRFREAGYTVTITDADHLVQNPLGIKVLFVANPLMLSQEERDIMDEFIENGGQVYEITHDYDGMLSVKEYGKVMGTYDLRYDIHDIADITGIYPKVLSDNPRVQTQVLKGDGYKLIVLTNISAVYSEVSVNITCNFAVSEAKLFAFDGERELEVSGSVIKVGTITDGGIVYIKE